ncbi:hypothetical protein [Yoonia sp. SS1-5]|uniref:DUF995 domain-containing protein n=1 Tax=Yoonia rhodophyticola TaxID=3137370 RepID=A0AAN0M6Y6_9RHOB
MFRFAMMAVLMPAMAGAVDWQWADGPAISAALRDQSLIYDNATQSFFASGRTVYDAGEASWGYWAVRGDQYCSQWPPSDGWDCYDVMVKPGKIRFIGVDGSMTDGMVIE